MRCFVAIELAAALRAPLVQLLRGLPRSREVRWCTEDQLHVTLKFLGEVEEGRIPKVCAALAAAGAQVEPFAVRLDGLGAFPTPRNPRVFWGGIADPAGGCARLVQLMDPPLEQLGFPREARAFTPHVTLGRSKSPAGNAVVRQALETARPPATAEMTVEQITLFQSILRPEGAQYVLVASVPLGRR